MRPSIQPSDINDSSLRRTLNKKIRSMADSSVSYLTAQGGASSIDKMKFTRTCSAQHLDNSENGQVPYTGVECEKYAL
ncbi:hypothetical protein GCM10027361_00820 [Erwinia aphidicola]